MAPLVVQGSYGPAPGPVRHVMEGERFGTFVTSHGPRPHGAERPSSRWGNGQVPSLPVPWSCSSAAERLVYTEQCGGSSPSRTTHGEVAEW